jgi:hypothetical protein
VDAQQWADCDENEAGSQEEGGGKGREVFDHCDSIETNHVSRSRCCRTRRKQTAEAQPSAVLVPYTLGWALFHVASLLILLTAA